MIPALLALLVLGSQLPAEEALPPASLPPAPVAAEAAKAPPAPCAEEDPCEFGVLVGVGGSVGQFAEFGLSIEAEYRFETRWSLELAGRFGTGGSEPLANGRVDLSRDAVALLLGWRWLSTSPWVGELLLGPSLEAWTYSVEGFSAGYSQTKWLFAVDAMARGRVALSERWFLWLALQLTVVPEPQTFIVQGSASLTTQHLWFAASAGGGVSF